MANKFKKNDVVKVLTGKDKGKISSITKSYPKADKLLVKGVNVVKKHIKPSKIVPNGGIISKEMPIHISNVTHIDPITNKPVKIGFRTLEGGKKARYFKVSGKLIDNKKY